LITILRLVAAMASRDGYISNVYVFDVLSVTVRILLYKYIHVSVDKSVYLFYLS